MTISKTLITDKYKIYSMNILLYCIYNPLPNVIIAIKKSPILHQYGHNENTLHTRNHTHETYSYTYTHTHGTYIYTKKIRTHTHIFSIVISSRVLKETVTTMN